MSGCLSECIAPYPPLQSHSLTPYADYCANLVTAKCALETQKQDPAVEDFLQVGSRFGPLCTVLSSLASFPGHAVEEEFSALIRLRGLGMSLYIH